MNPEPPPPPPPPSDEPPLNPYYGGPLGAGIDWSAVLTRLAPYQLTAGGVASVFVLGVAFVILAAVPLWHTDFWAHLRYGEWIATNQALPDREPLNPFTDKQQRMVNPQWLTQVGYHGLFRAGERLAGGDARRQFEGGVELIRFAHLAAAVAFVGLIGLACRRVADSVPWAWAAMLIVLILMTAPLAVQRPQTFGLLCFGLILCALSRPVPSRRAVVWVPLVLALWANLHGSFVVGFGLVGAALLGRAVEVYRAVDGGFRSAYRDLSVRRLAAALVLGLACVAVLNPSGPRLYLDVIGFGGHPNLRTVSEWLPLDFSQPRGGHWGYLATVVFLAITQLVSPRAFTPFQVLLILTLGVWPLFQQRAMAWWLPVVPWLAAPHWVAAAERWGWAAPGGRPDFRLTAVAGLLVALAAVVSPGTAWAKLGRPRPVQTAVHRGTPVAVASALRGEPAADADRVKELTRVVREWHGGRYIGRVFTSDVLGDYLLRALPEDTPVMMFNHAPLFSPAYWNSCLSAKAGGPGWWEFLDRHRVNVIVLEADTHVRLCNELRAQAALHKLDALLYPLTNVRLCSELRARTAWAVVVDETAGDSSGRLFVAVRKPPGHAETKP